MLLLARYARSAAITRDSLSLELGNEQLRKQGFMKQCRKETKSIKKKKKQKITVDNITAFERC